MTFHAPAHLRRLGAFAAAVALLAPAACSADDSGPGDASGSTTSMTTTSATTAGGGTPAGGVIVFNGQGNNLDAYAAEPEDDGAFPTQRVFTAAAEDPENGRDVNAQICFFTADDGSRRFIAGEDTDQDEPGGQAGWGIFTLEGDAVGDLVAAQVGKLEPTYQPTADGAENYGCGVLSDGRVVTTDVGDQASGSGDGQLIIWFPPLAGGTFPDYVAVPYCKLDVTIPTAQSILVVEDEVYVAAARGGVFRYPGPFPTGPTSAEGCDGTDGTGAPMATGVTRELVVPAGGDQVATPSGLAPAPDDGMYVSSVITGVIAEFDLDGAFRRTVLAPPAGEQLGPEPYSTGSPLGLGVDAGGTLYYADIGIVVTEDGAGPGEATGSVRRIRFVDGDPQPPEVMASGLAFPDGIGVLEP